MTSKKPTWIPVVTGVLRRGSYVLVGKRPEGHTLAGQWEFPGGKIEATETLKEAIEREIQEELACTVEFIDIFNDNTHEYYKFIVNLITVKCRLVAGTPTASEHSKLIWLHRENLLSLKWAPADVPAVEQLIAEKV